MAVIATAQFLTSLSDLKLHLEIGTTGLDSFLHRQLKATTKKIETYCNRKFASATYTEYHDGNGRDGFIFVNHPEILAVSSLHDDVNRDFGANTLIGTSEYVKYAAEGRIELLTNGSSLSSSLISATFISGQQNIKIVYTGGFANIPEDISLGCKEWIAKIWRRRDRKLWLLQSVSKGDVSTSYETIGEIPDEIKGYINPYRLYNMGYRY